MKGLFKRYRECNLCPRDCRRNRFREYGYCKEGAILRVAYVGVHFGEEPPITGKNGSGTVFFSGCSLKCSFCQNWQISHIGIGKRISVRRLAEKVYRLIEEKEVHNINFVTPDHFIPHVILLIEMIKKRYPSVPIVFNVSGYQNVELLKEIGDYIDIYLPDFKYSDRRLASRLSSCPNYPEIALDAISEMIRQKGFLETSPVAKKGVLVRHLILPGQIKNSIDALSMLFIEFGKELPISLMSQYKPVRKQRIEALNRQLMEEEFYQVYEHAISLGFKNMFVQFPEETKEDSEFLPDFTLSQPFRGNKRFDTDHVLW